MKTLSFLLTASVLCSYSLIAQVKTEKATVLWGPELKESKKSTLNDLVAYDETGIYVSKSNFKGYFSGYDIILEHFDNDLNKTKSVVLNLGEKKEKRTLELMIHFNDVLYVFSSKSNNEIKKNFLFVESINKKTLLSNNDLRKISEINFEGKKKRNNGDFMYSISRDKSKILIYNSLPFNKNENAKFSLHVFDQNLNQLWEDNITLPYEDKLFGVEDYQVSNKGNVYVLGKIYNENRRTYKRGKPNFKHRILSYINESSNNKEYPVEIQEHFITDMKIAIDNNENIICAGFYSELGTMSINGSYFLKIDGKSKNITTKSFKEFGIDFITQNMTKRQEKKTRKRDDKNKKIELYEYDLDNIILKDDGGAVLIGEQFFVRVVTTTTTDANGNISTTTNYYYNYNDIIVINISSEGEIEWTEKIPKRQVTKNDGGFYSSYALAVVDDKLYFVFNDNPKNLFYKGEGKVYNFIRNKKESLAVLVELSIEGRQTREALFSMREADVIIRPKVCEQTTKNELILFGQKKKKQRFAKVSFVK
ncbi:MAG: hypothetical protein CL853_06860 [Crocinitomicaceae bacterium]|nr:hypothetical protein [Crocinitomicaceae bacterium]